MNILNNQVSSLEDELVDLVEQLDAAEAILLWALDWCESHPTVTFGDLLSFVNNLYYRLQVYF